MTRCAACPAASKGTGTGKDSDIGTGTGIHMRTFIHSRTHTPSAYRACGVGPPTLTVLSSEALATRQRSTCRQRTTPVWPSERIQSRVSTHSPDTPSQKRRSPSRAPLKMRYGRQAHMTGQMLIVDEMHPGRGCRITQERMAEKRPAEQPLREAIGWSALALHWGQWGCGDTKRTEEERAVYMCGNTPNAVVVEATHGIRYRYRGRGRGRGKGWRRRNT